MALRLFGVYVRRMPTPPPIIAKLTPEEQAKREAAKARAAELREKSMQKFKPNADQRMPPPPERKQEDEAVLEREKPRPAMRPDNPHPLKKPPRKVAQPEHADGARVRLKGEFVNAGKLIARGVDRVMTVKRTGPSATLPGIIVTEVEWTEDGVTHTRAFPAGMLEPAP